MTQKKKKRKKSNNPLVNTTGPMLQSSPTQKKDRTRWNYSLAHVITNPSFCIKTGLDSLFRSFLPIGEMTKKSLQRLQRILRRLFESHIEISVLSLSKTTPVIGLSKNALYVWYVCTFRLLVLFAIKRWYHFIITCRTCVLKEAAPLIIKKIWIA